MTTLRAVVFPLYIDRGQHEATLKIFHHKNVPFELNRITAALPGSPARAAAARYAGQEEDEWDHLAPHVQAEAAAINIVSFVRSRWPDTPVEFWMAPVPVAHFLQKHEEPGEDEAGNDIMVKRPGVLLVVPERLDAGEYTLRLSEPPPWPIYFSLRGRAVSDD